MSREAKGTFEVSMKPESSEETSGVTLGRMALDKQYQGDLVATGTGEMLTAMTQTKGSASYAAFELVTGTLHGKEGSFVLHHQGTMNRGEQELTISIVPDSGSGELQGISGQCKIEISEGKHFYELSYSLPE